MTSDFLNRLTKVVIGPEFKLIETDNDSLTWLITTNNNDALEIMNLLLQKYNLSHRNPQIYLRINGAGSLIDITSLLGRYVKHLYIRNTNSFFCTVKASAEFSLCATLTHLTIQAHEIDSSVSPTLRGAIEREASPSQTCDNDKMLRSGVTF